MGSVGGRWAAVEIEVEVIGAATPARLTAQMQRLCAVAAAAAGVQEGHVAIEFVDAERIAAAERASTAARVDRPTCCRSRSTVRDAVATESRHASPRAGRRGDLPEHTVDLREAIVHGVLHLVGMDHESDDGEMLALQAEILRWERIDPQADRQS